MKIVIAILLSLSTSIALAQVNPVKHQVSAPDTLKNEYPNDSLLFVCSSDFLIYLQTLKATVPYETYIKLTPEAVISDFYKWAVLRWNERRYPNRQQK